MLPLELFKRRNFAAGNIETFAMYAGLSVLFFYLVLFLQQVAGYSALEAGLATLPTTAVMFVLSKRAGALADRYGAAPVHGRRAAAGRASGLALMLRVDADADYLTELLPALLVFSLGLSATVAPLTATVLADADEENAGIASGVNNAIARAAGLLGVAAHRRRDRRAVRRAQLNDRLDAVDALARRRGGRAGRRGPRAGRAPTCRACRPARRAQVAAAVEAASVSAFHTGMGISAALVGLGGILGIALVRTPAPRRLLPRTARAASSSRRPPRRCASGCRSPREPQLVLIRPPRSIYCS